MFAMGKPRQFGPAKGPRARGETTDVQRDSVALERRMFIRTLAAAAGGLALAACGGGGGGASATNSGSSAALPAGANASPSGSGTSNSTLAGTTNSTSAPTSVSIAAASFYGINGHLSSGGGAYDSISQSGQLALLRDLGVTVYRQDVYDVASTQKVAAMCNLIAGSGVQILPVITCGLPPAGTTESAAYSSAHALGSMVASALKGSVNAYECGNELEIPIVSGSGAAPSDYDATRWPAYRGTIRGIIDGVRSIDATAQVAINAGWLHYGALQMLASGTAPDGSTGPAVDWDITAWHWYSDMGDITNAGSGGVNVLQTLKSLFGKPIWLTEFGFRPDGSDANQANYLANVALPQYYRLRETYGIARVMIYELFDVLIAGNSDYGLVQQDGVTKKPAYAAVKNFIAAHPA